MSEVIIYSTHGYTVPFANQLKKLGMGYIESKNENDFLTQVKKQAHDLLILDSISETSIFKIVEKVQLLNIKHTVNILFLVPGKVSYEHDLNQLNCGTIMGISKPFSPKEFSNIVAFLYEKKKQHNKLIDSFADLEQFTVIASHDLKSPIKNVLAYADILRDELKNIDSSANKEIGGYVEIILSESKRMIQFVNDMFEYSRAGHAKLEAELFDLNDYINTIYARVSKAFAERKVTFSTDNIPKLFRADKTKVGHIFQNLIENAIKYSNAQTPLNIKISAVNYNIDETLFCVKDNGDGISGVDSKKIFLPFKRGKTKVKGTGIGLAIVEKLVRIHGGKIWLESELGQGSKFYFTLKKLTQEIEHDAA